MLVLFDQYTNNTCRALWTHQRRFEICLSFRRGTFREFGPPGDVMSYKKSDDQFPYEPTADQCFDETQFEAYKMLRYHSLKNVAGEVQSLRCVPAGWPWLPCLLPAASHMNTTGADAVSPRVTKRLDLSRWKPTPKGVCFAAQSCTAADIV